MKHLLISDDIGNLVYFDHPDGRMLCLPIATTQELMSANFNEKFSSMICGNAVFVFQKVNYVRASVSHVCSCVCVCEVRCTHRPHHRATRLGVYKMRVHQAHWRTCVVLMFVSTFCGVQYDNLTCSLMSDEGENDCSLQRELCLLWDLLVLVFGVKVVHYEQHRKQTNFLRFQQSLHKIFHSYWHLHTTPNRHSFLTQVRILEQLRNGIVADIVLIVCWVAGSKRASSSTVLRYPEAGCYLVVEQF